MQDTVNGNYKKPNRIITDTTKQAADAFISGAQDAAAMTQETLHRIRNEQKVQIALTITEPLLDRVDELAKQIGQCRAALINPAVIQILSP